MLWRFTKIFRGPSRSYNSLFYRSDRPIVRRVDRSPNFRVDRPPFRRHDDRSSAAAASRVSHSILAFVPRAFARHTPRSQVISHDTVPSSANRSPLIVKSFQNEICVSNVRRREDRLTSVGSLIKRRLRLPARQSVCPPARRQLYFAPPAHFGLMAPCLLTGV